MSSRTFVPRVPRRRVAGSAGVLGVLALVRALLHNRRLRDVAPPHTEGDFSITCIDGRYGYWRAREGLKVWLTWRGPNIRTTFPPAELGGGAALLHPVHGPSILLKLVVSMGVHAFDTVTLHFHLLDPTGSGAGCGSHAERLASGEPLWLGPDADPATAPLWSAFALHTVEGMREVADLAAKLVRKQLPGVKIVIQIDQFGHNMLGLPTVRPLVRYRYPG